MSETYKIRKDVSVPPPKSGGRGNSKYPWTELEPGDCFDVPYSDGHQVTVQNRVRSAGTSWCRHNAPHLKVITRKVGDCIRVWLVDKEAVR